MHSSASGRDDPVFCFGDYRLIPSRQLLLRGNSPVQVGSRALELLRYLVERPGLLVSKAELTRAAWPDTFVSESNLKVNIAALRRALLQSGAEASFIATVPGRGYRFVTAVRVEHAGPAGDSAGAAPMAAEIAARLVGRDDDVAEIVSRLSAKGFVTIVGPPGVGKTSVALAAARQAATQYQGGVHLVDLAAIGDARFAEAAVASAVGAGGSVKDLLSGIIDRLRGDRRLLVLDNCEHVLHAASVLAENIRAALPEVTILATSREPFRSRAETVYRLAPLPCPAEGDELDLARAMAYPAIALLAARAEDAAGYRISADDLPVIAEICRRLDGIPLAIELAAPRLVSFPPTTLLRVLSRSVELLSYGPPQAPIRQQALMAALDWSYRLLTDDEAAVLRLVSVFAGSFALTDMVGVARHLDRTAEELVGCVESLAAKSLLSLQFGEDGLRYRLLDTTRAYARERLSGAGEDRTAFASHAAYFRDLFEQADTEWQWRVRDEWTASYARHANDLRKAMDWCFGADGDARLGLRLAAAAVPLWDEMSTGGEGRERLEQALRSDAFAESEPRLRMKLTTAYAWALAYGERLEPEAEGLWKESLRLAELAGDADYQLRALWGLASLQSFTGRQLQALGSLSRFEEVARLAGDEAAALAGERLRVITGFYGGDTLGARCALTRIARRYDGLAQRPRISHFQIDQHVAARTALAFVTWVCGDPAEAAGTARAALEGAMALGHSVSVANTLAQAVIPIALWTGELDEAERGLARLSRLLKQRHLGIWEPLGRNFAGLILQERGEPGGIDGMRKALADLAEGNVLIRLPMHLSVLAEAAIASGRMEVAAESLATAGALLERGEELWCRPEVLRVHGLLQWRSGDAATAEETLHRALRLARDAGTLAFELRAATTLARCWSDAGRAADIPTLLSPILDRCGRMSGSRDLTVARALLAGERSRSAGRRG